MTFLIQTRRYGSGSIIFPKNEGNHDEEHEDKLIGRYRNGTRLDRQSNPEDLALERLRFRSLRLPCGHRPGTPASPSPAPHINPRLNPATASRPRGPASGSQLAAEQRLSIVCGNEHKRLKPTFGSMVPKRSLIGPGLRVVWKSNRLTAQLLIFSAIKLR